jgi:hypothetical protein
MKEKQLNVHSLNQESTVEDIKTEQNKGRGE